MQRIRSNILAQRQGFVAKSRKFGLDRTHGLIARDDLIRGTDDFAFHKLHRSNSSCGEGPEFVAIALGFNSTKASRHGEHKERSDESPH